MLQTQIHQFLSKENIQVLWDVLIEDPIVKNFCSSREKIIELTKIYESNLKGFYDIERKNCNNLIEINKKYILLIINYLNSQILISNSNSKTISNSQPQNQQQTFKKITIHDEIKQPITYEDIQNVRKSQFEKDLYNRQQEFTSAMSNQVPPVPDFSDKIDEPISEIEMEIKRIQEQRNYDIEIINKNYQDNIVNQLNQPDLILDNENPIKLTEKWLKSENTNIKNEKHISWEDDKQQFEKPRFFDKLKKIDQSEGVELYDSSKIEKISSSVPYNNLITNEIDFLKNEMLTLNNKLNMLIEKIDKMDKK